ncbi:hypothetical protein SAMN06265173_12813 [Thalassovita litoralis]|uniref:Uncharacterized protein n=1 Tax=Thalassovita litoralis TaxID=1010611 RepID=A0A521FGK6_9RHOB|nr:aminoacyltransferase [Thalassovita litoralis]SMO94690.1 hypothetical protein SAMN06265173_12813 [Thalassovita litoralis]
MSKAPKMKDMRERLDSIRREIEKLQAQESLLLDMMGEEPTKTTPKRAPKGSVKVRVLEMLESEGRSGLNAAKAVELSGAEGDALDRGSVSSLLSRLKQDDVVVYDGSNYRLKKYAGMPSVTPLRTSGDRQF